MVKLIVVLLVAFSTQFPSENAFKIKPRIVHGDLATERQFPFYAYLNIKTNQDIFGCGGALLNEEFILTAAHCTYDAVQVDVHLGMENIDNPGHFTAVVGKQNIFVCPRFFIRIAYNDMSLVRLPEKVQFSTHIQPVRLPTTCDIRDSTDVIAMGHGETEESFGIVRELRFAYLQTTPIEACRKIYPFIFWRSSVLCAQDQAQNRAVNSSICSGDSGSPLVTADGTLVGVTNLIPPDGCMTGAPQGFTKVVSYSKWIKRITGLQLPKC